jgi:gas vesicle protein
VAENNAGSVVGWFLGGIALGAVVALLLAPNSGRVTRHRLGKSAKKGRRALSESGQEVIQKGRELYERGRELAEEAADLFEKGRAIAEKKLNDVG